MSSTRNAVVGASTVTATGSGIFGTAGPLGEGAGVALGDGVAVAVAVGAVGAVGAPPVLAGAHAATRAMLSASVRRSVIPPPPKQASDGAMLVRLRGACG